MLSLEEYSKIVNDALARIELPENIPGLYEPIRYALASGGKRLRPVLLLACCQGFGGDLGQAIWPALGIEIFHNFTLLHDDVMDHAAVRRGRPTVCAKWDTNTAILSGDAMTSLAYKCISGCEPQFLPEMIDRYSMMTMNVYEGQQLDADMQAADKASFGEYIQMVTGKTAALIAYPCALGALLAGASQDDIEAMFNFGVSLGIAFQMQDDWLDVYGDPATFGKAVGGDILEGKKTWLHIIAADAGALPDTSSMTDAEKISAVTSVYDSLGLRDKGHKLIERYADDAVAALDRTTLPAEAKTFFKSLSDKLVNRNV